ncbi:MAG: 16S rRNA (cytosine(1402)-N(4))-methyltransferase RsmH [Bdellovibrionales bacterium]|nr:16S rRNA (cytosine(1402)-N(4))-methyltransferase RsmH [Oligoflexia bacterium]
MIDHQTHHVPILLASITDFLIDGLLALPEDAAPGLILDCTLGGGGHSFQIIEKMRTHPKLLKHRVLGVDRDLDAIARGLVRFRKEIDEEKIEIFHGSFSASLEAVASRPIYGLLADLGISSDQIDSETRGFSFRYPAPLDMRMNTSQGLSLLEWLQKVGERELSDVLFNYGDERFSRQIARKILDLRSRGSLPKTTLELAEAIVSTFPPALRYKGIHPATRSFQALRILVNDELGELEKLIRDVFPKVTSGGRIAILSFHSLEDRPVKEAFKNRELYDLPFKKPLEASDEEVADNSRARSAKLRFAIRK